MNALLFILLYVVAFPSPGLRAQDAAAVPLSIEQIKAEAERDFTDGGRIALMRRCLTSGKLDFVQAFLQYTGLTVYLAQEAVNLEPSVYKDRIFLMILRTPWAYDAPADTPQNFKIPGPEMPARCVKVIAGRLPAEPLDLEDEKVLRRFSDPAYRRQLANRFAAAIGEPLLQDDPGPETPPAPCAPDNKAHPSEVNGMKPKEKSAHEASSPEHLTWLITCVVVLAIFVGWSVIKRRGN